MVTPQYERRERIATVASHVAMAASLLLIMWQGLLPGLLCVCLGFLATRWFSPRLGALTRAHDHQAPKLAAGLVALIPVVLIAVFLPRTRGVILDAPNTYRELLAFMARTVLELRDRLPPDIAAQLPTGAEDVQRVIAAYLATKAGTLASWPWLQLGVLAAPFLALAFARRRSARANDHAMLTVVAMLATLGVTVLGDGLADTAKQGHLVVNAALAWLIVVAASTAVRRYRCERRLST